MSEHRERRTSSCAGCGATGIRLWREYGKFQRMERVLCFDCLPPDQRAKFNEEKATCGWWCAFVPNEDGAAWGYTSIPSRALQHWRDLPLVSAPEQPLSTSNQEQEMD